MFVVRVTRIIALLWATDIVRPETANADLLVGDWNNHQVLRFTDSGALIGPFGDANDSHGLGIPGGIAVDAAGNAYVKSISYGNILRFDPQGDFLGAWIDGGTGTQRGLAFDSQGNLWFRRLGFGSPPAFSSRMVKLDSGGNLVFEYDTLLAGYGPFAFDADDVLYIPHDEVYFPPIGPGDAFDGIYRFRTDGTALGAFGQATNALSGCVSPQGVLFDSRGHLLVDVVGRILDYGPGGEFLGTFATSNTSGYLVVDPLGNVYGTTADGVEKFDATGIPLGEIISTGVAGVPANFRSEAIAYIPAVPEPGSWSVVALLLPIGLCSRRRSRSCRARDA